MQRARLALLALAIGLSSVAAPMVQAADASASLTQHYQVPAGDLAGVLTGFARQAVEQGQGVYIVVSADGAADSTTLGVLLVTGERVAADPTATVGGVVARSSLSATKTGTDLLATPQAVNVVTREEIEARGAGDLAQALQYTPGAVSQYGNTDMRHDWFMVRGFNPGRFMDGLRLPFGVLGYAQPRIDPL
ncbi:TonB-dependent receptor plug domain-containing protein [Pseudomonas abyssi]|uniref:TonB-dependent receptor plug domain-containing protein n=1 Tax=Pseudomonas abyssi TaxID=170540 RepID=UPI003C7A1112